MRRIVVTSVVLFLILGPAVPMLGAIISEDDDRAQTFGEDPVWIDQLDDMGKVYVPPGGLVGVEVAGGEVRLLPGHDEGWIASEVITCPEGYRYDLVMLEAILPGDSYVNITILDASKAPTEEGFANDTVTGFRNITATDVSVFSLSRTTFPEIRIQVNLVASGVDRPTLQAWSLLYIALGEWRDDFLGTGKMIDHRGLIISGGTLGVDLSGPAGPGGYNPYPAVAFPNGRSTVDLFYPNSAGTSYDDRSTLTSTDVSQATEFGDLNGDGVLDLLLVRSDPNGGKQTLILFADSDGSLSTTGMVKLTAQFANDGAIGDFNGDGEMDVAISAIGDLVAPDTGIWLNQGGGRFNSDMDIDFHGMSTMCVAAGDLNNDGYDDVIYGQAMGRNAPCYHGGPGGPDTTADVTLLNDITVQSSINNILVQDVDGDDYLDVLVATRDSNGIAPIYLGSATGVDKTVDKRIQVKDPPMDVAAGDINGDDYCDIVYTEGSSSGVAPRIEMFEGTSSGWDTSHLHTISGSNTAANPVEVVDVDLDGYADVLTGEGTTFRVYMGGTSFPTAPSLSKTGIVSPSDLAVAVPKGALGGLTASFVTELISLPPAKKWDILHMDGSMPAESEVTITVMDPTMTPVDGFDELTEWDVDLSAIENWRNLYVKVSLRSFNNTTTPVLERLLVNWMDEMTWREQFYGKAKFGGSLSLDISAERLVGPLTIGSGPQLIFPCPRGDEGFSTPSLGFIDGGGGDFVSMDPIRFQARGAYSADVADVDGDGSLDIAFAAYRKAASSYDAESPVFLNSPSGWYKAPFRTFNTTGARDVLLKDLDGDSHVDIVFAQERDWDSYKVSSLLFWGSASGWGDEPDLELSTTGATDVDAVDVDGDGSLDLVFACSMDSTQEADSLVFLQESGGFCATVPSHRLPTVGANAVAHGDLDGDGALDLVFANGFSGSEYEIDSPIYWGRSSGGFATTPTSLPTLGAQDVQVADLNADGELDLVFANSRNDTESVHVDSFVYLNDGSGGFGPDPDVLLPTVGAQGVAAADLDGRGWMDLVFACKHDGESFVNPSMIYMGGASGWASAPDVLLPTEGATKVLATSFVDQDQGGYVSRPITPEDPVMAGGFHTFRYTASLGASQSARVLIVDSETEEVLVDVEVQDGTNEVDLRSAFSIRRHPSVRVMLVVDGLGSAGGVTFDDLFLNWTERSLVPPIVHGLGIEATSVLRTQSIEAWVNVSDEYYEPEELTVTIEHQMEGTFNWATYLIGDTEVRDGVWVVKLAPARNDPLGVYSLRVNVTDLDGNHTGFIAFPGTLEVLPNLPTEPTTVTATGEDGKVRVEWRPPVDKGDEPISGYRVHRGLAEDALVEHSLVDALSSSFLDQGLTNGVTYYYAVQAFSNLGDGPLSQVVSATPLGLPGQPRNFSAEAADGEVTITWEPPVRVGGTPILGYKVYRGMAIDEIIAHDDVEGPAYTDTGLTNGQIYYYWVAAYNALGEGVKTSYAFATPFGLPDAPREFSIEAGVGYLELLWKPPEFNGGSPITQFVIYRGLTEGSLETLIELGSMTLTYTDVDVVVGTEYFYAVAVVTAGGEGPMSQVRSAVPTGPPGVPMDLTALPRDAEVFLSWTEPESTGALPITGYVIMRGTRTDNMVELTRLGPRLNFTDASVINDRTYYYTVAAINEVGAGPFTEAVHVTPFEPSTVPGAPRTISGAVKGTKVTLTWTPPDSDGGADITGYIVLRGLSPDDMDPVANLDVVLMYIDEGLKRGTKYYYSVVAVNDVGEGEPVAAIELKIPKEQEDSPGFATMTTAIALLATSLALLESRRRERGP